MTRNKKKKNTIDRTTLDIIKAARKKSRDEEIAMYRKQISMYYWKGDKKHHARGGKHRKRYC